jgi:hypothetical protein
MNPCYQGAHLLFGRECLSDIGPQGMERSLGQPAFGAADSRMSE